MFNIVICDDQQNTLNKLECCIKKAVKTLNLQVNNFETHVDPNYVANFSQIHYKENNIYFLDIDFGEAEKNFNGLNLAKQIRNIDSNAYIIFITNYMKLSFHTFQLNLKAFDYINKATFNFKSLCNTLNNLKADFEIHNNQIGKDISIIVKSCFRNIELKIDDIYYFESMATKITIYTKNSIIQTNNTLKNIEKLILQKTTTSPFFRCHNSFLINCNYIKEVNKDGAIMVNNCICPIAKDKKTKIKKILEEKSIVL